MDENKKEPTKSELKKIEKLLAKADKLPEPVIRRIPKHRSVKEREHLGMAIAQTLSEYTDCYILLGFDTHGNSMVLINSANNLESRALSDLVEDFVITGGPTIHPSGETMDDRFEDDDEI